MIDSKRMLARTGTTWRINHGVLKLSLAISHHEGLAGGPPFIYSPISRCGVPRSFAFSAKGRVGAGGLAHAFTTHKKAGALPFSRSLREGGAFT